MHFFVFLLSVSALIVQGNAQYLRYYSDGLYQHPSYYPDTDIIPSPNLIPGGRLFWNLYARTSTSTTTCTVYTAVICAGRRKRFLTSDDDSIEPSPVNKIEVTQLAEMEPSIRKDRKADPQLPYWRDSPDYGVPESTFDHRFYLSANYNPYLSQPVIIADPRLFFRPITSTFTTTVRSTPVCSQPSGFNQC
ncbi:uncharacterized protein LOC124207815 [Daphnia pulex]|uniref:uncharacterized protein LOC124207815 n=1 Tax=Daphnia pulex TaxID=6669 RepID=UPI001EDCF3B4|nr:uncharacterized protein LOC124207815 [Daphnia pulex]